MLGVQMATPPMQRQNNDMWRARLPDDSSASPSAFSKTLRRAANQMHYICHPRSPPPARALLPRAKISPPAVVAQACARP
eukprot:5960886-Pyramimonas_sp.AAC.1